MTEDEIKTLLCKRFAPPVYAFFTEVGTSTGLAARYIDGVAYSLFNSMGHEIHGFEIKVSRSDFLNEMKQPQKSEDAMQYFHRWWLVAPKGVVAKEELPKDWGFMEVVNGKIFKRKQAKELKPVYSPAFVAACLRRATENVVPRETVWNQCQMAREEAKKEFAEKISNSKEKLESYRKTVAEFEQASGLTVLDTWKGGKELGEAVQFVLNGGLKIDYPIESSIRDLKSILEELEKFDSLRKKGFTIKVNH